MDISLHIFLIDNQIQIHFHDFYIIYINRKYNIGFKCIFYEITNLYCPGCGVTRMIFSILKLDFYQAFRFNPFLFILSPFLLLYIVDAFLINLFGKKSFFINKISDNVYLFLLILAILFGVLRNIPMFDYLIPTYV